MLVRIIFFTSNAYIWIDQGTICYIAEVIFKDTLTVLQKYTLLKNHGAFLQFICLNGPLFMDIVRLTAETVFQPLYGFEPRIFGLVDLHPNH